MQRKKDNFVQVIYGECVRYSGLLGDVFHTAVPRSTEHAVRPGMDPELSWIVPINETEFRRMVWFDMSGQHSAGNSLSARRFEKGSTQLNTAIESPQEYHRCLDSTDVYELI